MRKYVLGAAIGVIFLAYSAVLRHQHSEAVVAPASLSQDNSTGSTPSTTTANPAPNSHYKDGAYTGSVADAFYGNVQVRASIKAGKIVSVRFLQYPNDSPNSQNINQQAIPFLQRETIQAQSAKVNIVTGATQTSQAFIKSLASALSQASQN